MLSGLVGHPGHQHGSCEMEMGQGDKKYGKFVRLTRIFEIFIIVGEKEEETERT